MVANPKLSEIVQTLRGITFKLQVYEWMECNKAGPAVALTNKVANIKSDFHTLTESNERAYIPGKYLTNCDAQNTLLGR